MKIKKVKLKRLNLRNIQSPAGRDKYLLHLYIAGRTPNAITALSNLKSICENRLKGKYQIKVTDILKNPKSGRDAQILAIPTLKRKLPLPIRFVIGNLSNTERVLVGLDLN